MLIVDPDGMLRQVDANGWPALVDRFGPGVARVGLDPNQPLTGWELPFDDAETRPRNPVGGCVLMLMGAPEQVYAGPLAITGWNPDVTVPLSTRARTVVLGDGIVTAVRGLHTDVVAAVNGDPGSRPAGWVGEVATLAAHVRDDAMLPRDRFRAAARVWATALVRRLG